MSARASLLVVDEAAVVVSVVASVETVVCSVVGGVVARVVLEADTVSPVVASFPKRKINGKAMARAMTTIPMAAIAIQMPRPPDLPPAGGGGATGSLPGVGAPHSLQKRASSGSWLPQFEQYI
jgi:hypothetical protein